MSETTLLYSESRYLPVKLTPSELLDRVDQLSETFRLAGQLEARHEAEKARMKAELKDMEARQIRETKIIESRHEDRRVDVRHILDASAVLVREVRQDTGEVLRERAATRDELQRSIPGTEPEAVNDGPEGEWDDEGDEAHENGETDGDD